ncbi:hypothetical protein GQ600_20226 [Phytophthora cactorum]|nr:hypothetical protein GQ600_20226 [Phytophthora cactorum]
MFPPRTISNTNLLRSWVVRQEQANQLWLMLFLLLHTSGVAQGVSRL